MSVVATAPEDVTAEPVSQGISWRRELLWALGSGAMAMAIAAYVLQLWDMLPRVPLAPGGDGLLGNFLVRTLDTQTWLGVNEQVGYPWGSAWYDFTANYGDFTQLTIVKAMTFFTDDPSLVLNAFFLLTFPLVAMTGYASLRVLGFGTAVAAACAVVYALMPFHFYRGPVHLFLSAYYAVPVASALIVLLLSGRPLFARRAERAGLRAWLTPVTLLTLGAAVFVGASESYFAIFAAAILLVAAPVLALSRASWKAMIAPAVLVVTMMGTIVVAQSPTIVWHQQNGANDAVAQRSPFETEVYGLKLANLLLPVPQHRIEPLANLTELYYAESAIGGEGANPALGLLMAGGLLLVVLFAAAGALGRRGPPSPREALLRGAGLAGLIAFATATVGGGSALFSYLVNPQLRAWNRISVYMGFFGLIGLAAALTWSWRFLQTRRPALAVRPVAVAGLLLVCLVAFVDQTTRQMVPDYEASAAKWRSDGRFVNQLADRYAPGTPILQLPYVPYPENPPVVNMTDYEHLKGYLHAPQLKWSYAASKGRQPDDWGALSLPGQSMSRIVPAAVAAGFRGVYVDTNGYADRGVALLKELRDITGEPEALRSENGRLVLVDLTPVVPRVAAEPRRLRDEARAALVEPVRTTLGEGLYPQESDGSGRTWNWMEDEAVVDLDPTTGRAHRMVARFGLTTPGPRAATLRVELPDGTIRSFRSRPGRATQVSVPFTVPEHGGELRLSTDAPDETSDARDLRARLDKLRITDLALVELGRATRPERDRG